MNKLDANLSNSLIRGLACAAITPNLRSVLVFDSPTEIFQTVVQNLTWMLKQVTGNSVNVVQLGVIETEEDLWGSLGFSGDTTKNAVSWKPGLLDSRQDEGLRLVVIPDLMRLSLATARACVALMGSDVGYLERHGRKAFWQPNLCWLGGCFRQDVGLVSPHLLDRFALRLSYQDIRITNRESAIRQWLQSLDEQDEEQALIPLAQRDVLKQIFSLINPERGLQFPEINTDAQMRVLNYIVPTKNYSARRDLALMRLAYTNALLEGSKQVKKAHVDIAAKMLGLEVSNSLLDINLNREESTQLDSLAEAGSLAEKSTSEIKLRSDLERPIYSPTQWPVYAPDTSEIFPPNSIEMDQAMEIANPYPEDTTPALRESASLRLPLRRFGNAVLGRGMIVGVEPTTIPQDLAIVSTLLEAAKYRSIRRTALIGQDSHGTKITNGQSSDSDVFQSLILRPTDLRRYRRAVIPEQMLTVVLDYTAVRDCKWWESLLPYLQWAYVERASLCLVQVGKENVVHELQAEKIVVHNVLVPRITQELEATKGKSTPLAHGLDLALQTLRHALQHGRSALQHAILVVISDGRGNVPLKSSLTNQKPEKPVNRQGIEDALQVAREIAALKQIKAIVLNPQPKYYSDLPIDLAQALGAKIAVIPKLRAWEVSE